METTERTDLSGLSVDELEAELATLASHIYAGTCRWLELVGEIDRRGGWAEEGRGSCADWLAWRCALTPRAAREHVRVARRLPGLPLTRAAFARGELSYTKVRALTRVATAENEEGLLELARVSDRGAAGARGPRVPAGDHRGGARPPGRRPPGRLLGRRTGRSRSTAGWRPRTVLSSCARWRRCATGCGAEPAEGQVARFRGTAAGTAGVLARRRCSRSPTQPWRTRAKRRPAGERYQVVVHVDEAVLSHDGEGGCELEDGSALSPETARRLACDASVVAGSR